MELTHKRASTISRNVGEGARVEKGKEGTKKGLEQELFKPLHEEKRVDKAKTHTNHEQDDVQQALVVLID